MKPLLQTTAVSKHFGGVQALRGASVSVEPGSITALIGPNGAGKTTLFNAVTGFARPDSGEIIFDEQRIDRLPAWRIAKLGLARTFQTPAGFPTLTALENLMVAGSSPDSESVAAALLGRAYWGRTQTGIAGRALKLIGSLDLLPARDTRMQELSAADTKLVEIVRQLMINPKMLLLDEPASGFSPNRLGRLSAFIRELNSSGLTVLLIEHNLSFVFDLAQHVYVLAGGTVISEGSPAEVAQDQQVIQHYLGSSHGPSNHH